MAEPQTDTEQTRYMALPDGSYLEIPPGVTDEQIAARKAELFRLHPDWPQPTGAQPQQQEPQQEQQPVEEPKQKSLLRRGAEAVWQGANAAINPLYGVAEPLAGVGQKVVEASQGRTFSDPAAQKYVQDKSVANRANLGVAVAADTAKQLGGTLIGGTAMLPDMVYNRPIETIKAIYQGTKEDLGTLANTGERYQEARQAEEGGDQFAMNRFYADTLTAGATAADIVGLTPTKAVRSAARMGRRAPGAPRTEPPVTGGDYAEAAQAPSLQAPSSSDDVVRLAPEGSRIPYSGAELDLKAGKETGIKPTLAGSVPGMSGVVRFANSIGGTGMLSTAKSKKIISQADDIFHAFAKEFNLEDGNFSSNVIDKEAIGDMTLKVTNRYLNGREKSMFVGGRRIPINEDQKFMTFRDRADLMYQKAYAGVDMNANAVLGRTAKEINEQRGVTRNVVLGDVLKNSTIEKIGKVFDALVADRNRVSTQREATVDALRLSNENARAFQLTAEELDGIADDIAKRFPELNKQEAKSFALWRLNLGMREAGQGNIAARRSSILAQDKRANRAYRGEEAAARGAAQEARDASGRNTPTAPLPEANPAYEITINDLRAMRTFMREKLVETKIVKGVDDASIVAVIDALTDDILNSVREVAGDGAARRLMAADRFYGRNMERIIKAFRPIMDTTGKRVSGTTVYNRLLKLAGRKGGSIKAVRKLRHALKGPEIDELGQGLFVQMGINDADGIWSPELFLKQWDAMDPRARASLFWRRGDPERLQRINNFVRALRGIHRVERSLPSTVAQYSGATITFVGGVVGLPQMLKVAFGSQVVGQLLLSRTFSNFVMNAWVTPRRLVRFLDDQVRAGTIDAAWVDQVRKAFEAGELNEEMVAKIALVGGLMAHASSDEASSDISAALLMQIQALEEKANEAQGATQGLRDQLNAAPRKTAASYPNGNTQLTDAQGAPIGQPEAPYQPMREQLPPGR